MGSNSNYWSEREKKKRNRATNFTEQETRLLMALVPKQLDVIESKQMDGVSWRAKDGAWEKLCEEFNLRSGTILRTSLQLRTKYESMKSILKRKMFKNRQEMYKTSGSPPHIVALTDYEEKLFSMAISGDGLNSSTDGNQDLEDIPGSSTVIDPLNVVSIADETSQKLPKTEEKLLETPQDIHDNNSTLDAEPSPWMHIKVDRYSISDGEKLSSTQTQNRSRKKDFKEKFYALVDARTELLDLQIQTAKSDLKLKERQLQNMEEEKSRTAEKHRKEMEIIDREIRRKAEQQMQEAERHLKEMQLLELKKQLCLEKMNNKIC